MTRFMELIQLRALDAWFTLGVSDWWDGVRDWWGGDAPPDPSQPPPPVVEHVPWLTMTVEVVVLILIMLAACVMLWGVARTVAGIVGTEITGCTAPARGRVLGVMGYYLKLGIDVLIVASVLALAIAPTFPLLAMMGSLVGVRLALACASALAHSSHDSAASETGG